MSIVLTTGPGVDTVTAIAAMDNIALRNLQITQCYAELSTAMRMRTGAAADWCTFATWASRQAGNTIRGEDFLDRLQRILGERSWVLAPLQSVSLSARACCTYSFPPRRRGPISRTTRWRR